MSRKTNIFNHRSGLTGAVASAIGGRAENQDSYLVADSRAGLLVIVCDGMGGGPGGKTASTLAAQTIADVAINSAPGKSPIDLMRRCAQEANKAVKEAADADSSLNGMGTTCVAALFKGAKAYVVNVGDSRFYQLRDGRIIFRTADHSQVGEMVREGSMTEEEARNSPYSNIITRALGAAQDVEEDVDVVTVKPGDRFALMTDGIWGSMPEPELIGMLSETGSVEQIVDRVATLVDEEGKAAGGRHDNLTLALIETKSGGGAAAVAIADAGADEEEYSLDDDNYSGEHGDAADVAIGGGIPSDPSDDSDEDSGGKSNKGIIWVLLLIAILGVAGYFLWGRFGGEARKPSDSVADTSKVDTLKDSLKIDSLALAPTTPPAASASSSYGGSRSYGSYGSGSYTPDYSGAFGDDTLPQEAAPEVAAPESEVKKSMSKPERDPQTPAEHIEYVVELLTYLATDYPDSFSKTDQPAKFQERELDRNAAYAKIDKSLKEYRKSFRSGDAQSQVQQKKAQTIMQGIQKSNIRVLNPSNAQPAQSAKSDVDRYLRAVKKDLM